jgi:microsomal dipeptidase-like Zn-dependent dipeptidase
MTKLFVWLSLSSVVIVSLFVLASFTVGSGSAQAPRITGFKHDSDSVPKGGRFTILGSNFGTQEGKGVALSGHGIHVDLKVISWSDTSIVVEVPDDPRLQEGQSYYVGIEKVDHSQWLSNIDKVIKVGKAVMPPQIDPGKLPPIKLPPIKLEPTSLIGWADLHAHPASHLAFGGVFHGSPGMGLRDSDPTRDMPECSPDKHAGFDADGVRDELRKRIVRVIDAKTGLRHGPHGPPTYRDWPHSQSLIHQQMHVRMIRRAYEAGLRVMIASVTDNQVLEKLFARTGFNIGGNTVRDPDSGREYDSAVRQIEFIRRFVQANSDWMQIVRTPQEARDAIRNNKLAIILGVEMDSLSVAQIVSLIDRYDVRSVIPIHLADNPHFGGTAVYDDAFNTLNWYLNNYFFGVETDPQLRVRLGVPQKLVSGDMGAIKPEPADVDPYVSLRFRGQGFKNALGLTNPDGIKRLMQKGILLDVAHMSERTTADVLRIAESFNYPLINSHSGLRDGQERAESERAMMRQHATRMARLGGVLGLGTETSGKIVLLDTSADPGIRRDESKRIWRFGTRQLNRGVLPITPNEGETDRFVLSVETGGDNLDSGFGFRVFIRFTSGPELFWDNVNRNQELPGHSVQSFVLYPASATRGARPRVNLRDLREIELQSEWDPGLFRNVEWDINNVRLEAFSVSDDPVAVWLRIYRDATSVMGQGMAFGTDFNGFAPQIPFSRGRVSYPIQVEREVRIAEGLITRESPYVIGPELSGPFRLGGKTYDFSRDGLAHYGMMPEFLQDLWNRGPEGQEVVRSLFRSAERLIRAWEGAWAAKDRVR